MVSNVLLLKRVYAWLQDPQNNDRNRGFAFVEYYNNACAENARRKLSMPGFKLGTNPPTINWADTRGSTDSAAMSQVSSDNLSC